MDAEAIRTAIAATDARFGRLDILVNNAGGVSGRPFLEQSERSWRRHIDINLVSMLAATHAAAPLMMRAKGGAILNVASIEAERAAPNFAVYPACKAGMVSFTKSMAIELSGHGIRVNCLAPDHTVTPGNQGNRSGPVDPASWRQRDADEVDAMNRLIPLGREGIDTECGGGFSLLCAGELCNGDHSAGGRRHLGRGRLGAGAKRQVDAQRGSFVWWMSPPAASRNPFSCKTKFTI